MVPFRSLIKSVGKATNERPNDSVTLSRDFRDSYIML